MVLDFRGVLIEILTADGFNACNIVSMFSAFIAVTLEFQYKINVTKCGCRERVSQKYCNWGKFKKIKKDK
jgi:hypothetical protein